MESVPLLDCAGRRRSPATLPSFHQGRPARNKGLRYPPDPPTVEEIIKVVEPPVHGVSLEGCQDLDHAWMPLRHLQQQLDETRRSATALPLREQAPDRCIELNDLVTGVLHGRFGWPAATVVNRRQPEGQVLHDCSASCAAGPRARRPRPPSALLSPACPTRRRTSRW